MQQPLLLHHVRECINTSVGLVCQITEVAALRCGSKLLHGHGSMSRQGVPASRKAPRPPFGKLQGDTGSTA